MTKLLSLLLGVILLTTNIVSAQETLHIRNVNILSMTDESIIENTSILIQDGIIKAIGSADLLKVNKKTRVIDGAGQYLMPGLIEMHIHIRKKETLKEYLKYGFTSVRNMNGNFGDPLSWRQEIKEGELLAPDLFTSSPTIIGTRHAEVIRPDYQYQINSPEEARVWARKYKTDGYDLIKVFRLEKDPFFALIDESEKVGINVSGHLPDVNMDGDSIHYSDIRVEQALATGMGVEHAIELMRAAFKNDKSEASIDYIIKLLKDNNTTVSTLLGNDYRYHGLATQGQEFLSDSLLALTRKYHGEDGVDQLNSIIENQPDVDLDEEISFEFVLSVLERFNDAGVNIVIGTDSHSLLNIAGASAIQEMFFLKRAGFSNYDVLKTATINAAKALNSYDELGSIAVGKKANLLLLPGNPLVNIESLRSPVALVLRGSWMDIDSLTEE